MASRRRVQRHAEMSELPARLGAGLAQSARDGRRDEAENESAELVSRRESAGELLGTGTRLPSHRTDLDELRAARGIAISVGRRIGEAFPPARVQPQTAGKWIE